MVDERPAGIPASAHKLWDEGVAGIRPNVGDLWVLSWDGEVVGVALVAAAKDGYVLAWPVTLPGETSFAPGLKVEQSPLGVPVTIWPTRVTGLGAHLLDRNLGRLLDPATVRSVTLAIDDDEDPGLPFAAGAALDEKNHEADEALIERWTELCFNTGGAVEGPFLDATKIQQVGGSSQAVAAALGVGPQSMRELLKGLIPITDEQLTLVTKRLAVDEDAVVGPDPLADVVVDLARPEYKRAILARAAVTGLGEAEIRWSSRREFALAARNDGDALRETKLRDAISRAGRGNS